MQPHSFAPIGAFPYPERLEGPQFIRLVINQVQSNENQFCNGGDSLWREVDQGVGFSGMNDVERVLIVLGEWFPNTGFVT